jgi:hypothetical protein
VLLGEAEQTGGAASLTVQPPPSTGALQVITPSGTTQLVVTGGTSGAKYFAGPPAVGGITSVAINQAADLGYVVGSNGPNGTVLVTTFPSSGVSSSPGSSPLVGEYPSSMATIQFTTAPVGSISASLSKVPAGSALLLVVFQSFANAGPEVSDSFASPYTWTDIAASGMNTPMYAAFQAWVGLGGEGGSGTITYSIPGTTGYMSAFACAIPVFGFSATSEVIAATEEYAAGALVNPPPTQNVPRAGSFGVGIASMIGDAGPLRLEWETGTAGAPPVVMVRPSGYGGSGSPQNVDAAIALVPNLPGGSGFDTMFAYELCGSPTWYGAAASLVFPS